MKLSDILWRWEITYDILKNKYRDGRYVALPEHVRRGFIKLYDYAIQLEAENERLRQNPDDAKQWIHAHGCSWINEQACTCGLAQYVHALGGE